MTLGCSVKLKPTSLYTLPFLRHAQFRQTHTGILFFASVRVVNIGGLIELVKNVFWSVLYINYVPELVI